MANKLTTALIGVVYAVATPSIAWAAPPADAGPPEWVEDAKVLARQEGISMGEAIRRTKMEARIGALEERLERENPNASSQEALNHTRSQKRIPLMGPDSKFRSNCLVGTLIWFKRFI
jgi:hypothetical protein